VVIFWTFVNSRYDECQVVNGCRDRNVLFEVRFLASSGHEKLSQKKRRKDRRKQSFCFLYRLSMVRELLDGGFRTRALTCRLFL